MPASRSKADVAGPSPPLSQPPPQPHDLTTFLPYACAQLQAQFALRVLVKEPDEFDELKADKLKRFKSRMSMARMSLARMSMTQIASVRSTRAVTGSVTKFSDGDSASMELPLTLMRGHGGGGGHFAELRLERQPCLPPLLLRLLALCLPHQPALERLTVRRVGLDATALTDMARLLPLSNLTDVCLDDSPAEHLYYDELLAVPGRLRRLSLARVQLGDEGCLSLAARLAPPWPAARTLRVLTLCSNGITDVGAAALGDTLRVNRSLQYLNLAGNAVSDDGAEAILNSLMEFRLTREEVVAKRRRRMQYLREYDTAYKRCFEESTAALAGRGVEEPRRGGRRGGASVSSGRSARSSRPGLSGGSPGGGGGGGGGAGGGPEGAAGRAHAAATEMMDGPFRDPFAGREVEVRGSDVYSKGNLVLSALNLAYNRVGHAGLLRLQDVLVYQEGGAGLVRVLLEGNPMPSSGSALVCVQWLLERAIISGSAGKMPKRKSKKSNYIHI